MPFCDVIELFEYWSDYPPAHILIRSYLGYEAPKKKVESDDMQQAMRVLNPTMRGAKKLTGASDRVRKMAESLKKAANG